MSDLNPTGVPIEIEGEERRLLFTFNAIDAIQERLEKPLSEAIGKLTDKTEAHHTLIAILGELLEDETQREKARSGKDLKSYTEKELGWIVNINNQYEFIIAIMEAYGVSLPKADEGDLPNSESETT